MTRRRALHEKLKDKAYRDEYVSANVATNLAYQIRALRKQRGWTQKDLGDRMKGEGRQPAISRLEMPGRHNYNVATLKKLAAAFDVALMIRFVPFSELIRWLERLTPESHYAVGFADDHAIVPAIRVGDSTVPSNVVEGVFGLTTGAPQNGGTTAPPRSVNG